MPDQHRPQTGVSRLAVDWRAHVHLVAAVLAVVVALIVLVVFLATRQSELSEGTPVATTAIPATPVIAPTEPDVASPEDEIAYPAGSLPALLTLAPDQLDDDEDGLPVEATYADIEGWLASMELDPDLLEDDELERAIEPLEIPEVLETRGLSSEWREVYGFDLRQVDQILSVGHAPNQILIMPGRYDVQLLYSTWVESGYQAVEVEETTVWSLFPGERIDLSAPASRPALGLLNTVVLLDDGTLIATARLSRMAEALQVAQGDDDSLFDNDSLRAAAVSPGNATSPCVVIASGRLLQQSGQDGTVPPARASPSAGVSRTTASLEPPEVDVVVFALVPPEGDGAGSIAMTMIYEDPPEGIAALAAALEARAAQDAEWSEQYRLESVAVTGEENDMIEVRFSPVGTKTNGLELIRNRDLGPFTWTVEE